MWKKRKADAIAVFFSELLAISSILAVIVIGVRLHLDFNR